MQFKYKSSPPTLLNDHVTEPLVDSAGNLKVSSGGSGTTADQVQGNVASGAADSGNPVKIGAVFNTALPTLTAGQRGDAQMDANGNLKTRLVGTPVTGIRGVSNAALTSLLLPTDTGSSLRPTAFAPFRFNGTSWDPDTKPNAAARLLSSAATTNATSVKTSAGELFKIFGYCAAAAAVFLKFYNKASSPTVGTDTPVLTFRLGPTSNFEFDLDGQYFPAGLAYAITGAAADADTTAVAAGDVIAMNLTYA